MTNREIRPFRIDIPQAELDDLRLRLTRTRWIMTCPVPVGSAVCRPPT
ncbi:hypothetical protein ACRS5S_07720 [Nocardia asiatica]